MIAFVDVPPGTRFLPQAAEQIWLHPASRSPSRCRNAAIQAGSWRASRPRFTVVLSAKLPNSM